MYWAHTNMAYTHRADTHIMGTHTGRIHIYMSEEGRGGKIVEAKEQYTQTDERKQVDGGMEKGHTSMHTTAQPKHTVHTTTHSQ